jgi:hypothetical protein
MPTLLSRGFSFVALSLLLIGIAVGGGGAYFLTTTPCTSKYADSTCAPEAAVGIVTTVLGFTAAVVGLVLLIVTVVLTLTFGRALQGIQAPLLTTGRVVRILNAGIPAVVTVLELRPTPVRVGRDYLIGTRLLVNSSQTVAPYETWVVMPIPAWALPLVGRQYLAAVDPQDPLAVALRPLNPLGTDPGTAQG